VKATHDAWVGLGANLNDPRQQLLRAFEALEALPTTRLVARSPLYLSEPVSDIPQDDYINAVARLKTALEPLHLLDALQDIEQKHGRQRIAGVVNGPRTLDLDLLLYDDRIMDTSRLTLPHPRMTARRFVLQPMADIDPRQRIPGAGTVGALLANAPELRLQRLD